MIHVPDLNEAQRFLDILAPGEEVTFQTFSERTTDMKTSVDTGGHTREYVPSAAVLHGTLTKIAAALADYNKRGIGVFVMVNRGDGIAHEGAKSCRTNGNVIAIRAHVLDLDGAPLERVLESDAPPHIVVESSPGRYHVYWRVKDGAIEDYSEKQARLAERFGGDPSVKDLARVLRVPGFWNYKRAQPFMVRMIAPAAQEKAV